MTATILALDLGTTTGWAARVDGRVVSGVSSFRPYRFEGGGMRYLRFRRWLTELNSSLGGIEEIAFEEVRRHLGVDAAHAYGGFMATMTAWAEHHETPYSGVPVGTIKKFITGKGNANKKAVIAAIKARGFEPADDNEAYAIAILLWAEDNGSNAR
jgi:Holliday junction resolvasome RuvABC endonuclease subunit